MQSQHTVPAAERLRKCAGAAASPAVTSNDPRNISHLHLQTLEALRWGASIRHRHSAVTRLQAASRRPPSRGTNFDLRPLPQARASLLVRLMRAMCFWVCAGLSAEMPSARWREREKCS